MTPPPSAPDAVFRVTDFSVSTEKVAPEGRYYVRTTHHYSADGVERESGPQEVVDVGEVDDPAVRDALKEVLREGSVLRNEIPDGLREVTEAVDCFAWDAETDPDQTHTRWAVAVYDAHPDRAPVVEFDATLVDDVVAPGDPGTLSFSLTNVGEHRQRVDSGKVVPFGLLRAESADARVLLWRDYEQEGVSFTDRGIAMPAVGVRTPVEPGETIEREYELRRSPPVGDDLVPGEYVVSGMVSYRRADQHLGPSTLVEWEVGFSVERA